MAYEDNNKPYVRETVRTTEKSSSGMALLVGGLVVAVGFILWLVFGGTAPVTTTTEPVSDTTNVTIEPPAAPADNSTNLTIDADEPAPAGDVVAPPADTGAAPADTGTETVIDPATATETAPADQ